MNVAFTIWQQQLKVHFFNHAAHQCKS